MAMSASTPVPTSEAKTLHLSKLAEAVTGGSTSGSRLPGTGNQRLSWCPWDDLEGIEMTLEILGDSDAVARILQRLAALGRGERGVDLATVWGRSCPASSQRRVNGERYEVRFQAAARRAIAERLPESVAAAVLEFCEAALALSPRRVGKPLFGPLDGCHGARRGTYRVVYTVSTIKPMSSKCSISTTALDIYHRSLPAPRDRLANDLVRDNNPDTAGT